MVNKAEYLDGDVKLIVSIRTAKGFSLFAVVSFLLFSSIAAISVQKAYAHYSWLKRLHSVGSYVETIFPIVNSYYKTECYVNGGIPPSTLTFTNLVDKGYLSSGYPTPDLGVITFEIDNTSGTTKFVAVMTMRSNEEAAQIEKLQSKYEVSRINNELRYVTPASIYRDDLADRNTDNIWFVDTSTCN